MAIHRFHPLRLSMTFLKLLTLNIEFTQIDRILLQPIEIHFITHSIAEIYLSDSLFA